ncbi:MAG: hypothetical protein H6707_16080 [Deltaproteobacteria bacterium]|nr:hypothetical protein [Deltaproteobacteria bacterium]
MIITLVLGVQAGCRCGEKPRADQRRVDAGQLIAPPSEIHLAVDVLPRAPLDPFDPAIGLWTERLLVGPVYQTLLRRTEQGALEAGLARFSRVPDGLRIELGRHRLHDGRLLTAEQVKAALESHHRRGSLLKADLARITVEGASRLLIAQRRFDSALLYRLAVLPIAIAGRSNGWLGTGPFRPQFAGKRLHLIPWREGRREPGRPVLVVAPLAQPAAALNLLRNREADLIARLPPELGPTLSQAKGLSLLRRRLMRPRLLLFNCRHFYLRRAEVRQAIGLAIDRRTLTRMRDVWWPGSLVEAAGVLGDGIAEPPAADLPRARQRLIEAFSWPRPPRGNWVRLSLLHGSGDAALAQAIRQALQPLGMIVQPVLAEPMYMRARLDAGGFQLALIGLALRAEPDLRRYLAASGPGNFGACGDSAIDRAIEQLADQTDAKARGLLYRTIDQRLRAVLPHLILYSPVEVSVYQRKLAGVSPAGDWIDLAKLRMLR